MNARRTTTLFAVLAVSAVALGACESPPAMHVAASTVATGDDVVVTFDAPLAGRATNQYWIVLAPADAPVADTTARVVLQHGERGVRLRATHPGDYEVRLHDHFPKEEHHLVARLRVQVEGLPVKTGNAQTPAAEECMDRWLAAQNLDEFGAQKGTAHAGSTPLFDETTGTMRSRWDYVVSLHPGLARTCDPTNGPR